MPSTLRYYNANCKLGEKMNELLGETDVLIRTHAEEIGCDFVVTDDIYSNAEYGEVPDWIELTINDTAVLTFKLVANLIKSIDGCDSITMCVTANSGPQFAVKTEWGSYPWATLYITKGRGIYLNVGIHNVSESYELNVTEQFFQSIGEPFGKL
jgi:hypothetical protein